MFSAVALPAHLAVTVLLAVLALRMAAAAEKKGRGLLRWMIAFFGLWLGTFGLVACAVWWTYERHNHIRPGFWLVYGPAVGSAFAAVLALRWVLAKRPALSAPDAAPPARDEPRPTPPLPSTPQPQPTPARLPTPPLPPAPPPEPVPFKFACPHCGQRLAVTTAEVGTTANCPNCDTLLEVPEPTAV